MTMALILIAAVEGWQAGLITIAVSLLTAVATWIQSKRKTAADAENSLAQAEMTRAKKDMELYDTAMKYASELKQDLKEKQKLLEESEKEAHEYREKFFALEEKCREQRHELKNMEQKVVLIEQEFEEYKKRQELNVQFLEREIIRLKNKN